MNGQALLLNLRDRGFSVSLDNGQLVVSPARHLDQATRDLIRANKSQMLQALATKMVWPDARSDPLLRWAQQIRRGVIELPAHVTFIESESGLVTVEPLGYVLDKLGRLAWMRSSIAIGGIGDWKPAWFQAQAERLRTNLAALKDACDKGKKGVKCKNDDP